MRRGEDHEIYIEFLECFYGNVLALLLGYRWECLCIVANPWIDIVLD